MTVRTGVVIFSCVILTLVMLAVIFMAIKMKSATIDIRSKSELLALLKTNEFEALRKKNGAGDFPDKLELLALLRENRFEALDARLVAYQKGYESEKNLEKYVDFAFFAFANSDPKLQAKLDQWVLMMPNSYAAPLARGIYHWRLGWVSRQYALAKKTSRQRFKVMGIQFTRAAADLTAAINLNKKLSIGYGLLISIANATRNRKDVDRFLKLGLEANPDSMAIRSRYLFALQPKWGGSIKAIEAFIEDTKSEFERYPKLRVLQAYPLYATAINLIWNDKRREAVKFFNQALQYGDNWSMYYQRGRNYRALEQYDMALADLNRALKLRPQVADVLDVRAWVHREQGRHHPSLVDWNLSLKLNAMEPDVLWARSLVLRNLRFHNESLRDLDNALIYGVDDDRYWNERGHLYLYAFRNPKKAIPDFERAIELNPSDRPDHWLHLGTALFMSHDCKFINTFIAYRRLCGSGKACDQEQLDWANQIVRDLKKWDFCPQ